MLKSYKYPGETGYPHTAEEGSLPPGVEVAPTSESLPAGYRFKTGSLNEIEQIPGYTPPTANSTTSPPASAGASAAPTAPTTPAAAYGMPEPPKPTTTPSAAYTAADTEVQKYKPKYDPAKFQQMIDESSASIKAKYDIERSDLATRTENLRQSQISGLYSVGVVNPLSSGLASIGAASEETKNKELRNIDAVERAEKNLAIKEIYGLEAEEEKAALEFAVNERDRIKSEEDEKYAKDRQYWTDKTSQINNVWTKYKDGKTIENQERDDARGNITTLITQFGSAAFEGLTEEKLAELEKAAGYPEGSLVRGIKTLKEQEIAAKAAGKALNLREIDGSLYNITSDKDGNVKSELVIKGKSSAKKEGEYKFDTTAKGMLLNAGLTTEDITSIQNDINLYGKETAFEGLNDAQKKVVEDILSGKTATQINAGEDNVDLEAAMKEIGTPWWYKLLSGVASGVVNAFK